MSLIPFPQPGREDPGDLMTKVAQLVRDTGISVKQAIQIMKGLEDDTPKKPSTHRESALRDVTPTKGRNSPSIVRAVKPYFDALALLEVQLSRFHASGKKKKKCMCWFDSQYSDGGTFERRIVECLSKHEEPELIAKALRERKEALLSWVEAGDDCRMDLSPEHAERVIAAVAHIVPDQSLTRLDEVG